MYLLLLINIIQGKNQRSTADRVKHKGSNMYKAMRKLPLLRESLQDVPIDATNECRDNSVEELNEGNMMYYICLLGEQIALANKGVVPREDETEKMKELFMTLHAPPPGQGILGIGGIRKSEGIGTVVFLITDSEEI
eukprot:879227-Ditylum_brightwellii.AAC.1